MALPAIERREHRRILWFCGMLPGVVAILTILTGAVVLVAWRTGYGTLTGGTGQIAMHPITALTFIVAGLALLVAQRRDSRALTIVSRLLAVGVAGVGLFTLFEYAMGWPHSYELAGFPTDRRPTGEPLRMAVNTAIGFVLFGQGLVFLESDRRTRGLKSQFFATLLMIIAFIAIIGHVFDVRDFYSFRLLAGMALTTAIGLSLLGLGLLFSQLDRGVPALVVDDGTAGFVARRLLPGALFVPFGLAFLGVLGEERGIVGQRLGGSLVAVANMVIFLLLISWSARVVRLVDRKRGELFVLEREAHDASERARSEAEAAMQQAEAARAEAESANGAKSDFLAVMSHELRTPLAAIMGYQELLADGITGPVTDAQGQQLGRIKVSARHLLSLIDEILTFTRLDAGRESVVEETVDLGDVMRDALEIVEPLAEAKKLDVVVSWPAPDLKIQSDLTKLRQIIVNLLSNAVKFTEKGSVSLDGKVIGDEVRITVSDTGIGIHADHLNRIFDPFWQVEQTATRRAPGTGLGLTVTRRLANLMGGDVTVTSREGEGTTFIVTLPAKLPHMATMPSNAKNLRTA
ncbi:MAG: sensor histidine kinase [Gemmatimonadaceae bacterium]